MSPFVAPCRSARSMACAGHPNSGAFRDGWKFIIHLSTGVDRIWVGKNFCLLNKQCLRGQIGREATVRYQ